MEIVNTFISDPGVKIPEYTVYSLQKLREHNPDVPITFISNTRHGFDSVFKKYDVKWVDQNCLNSFYLESFHSLSNLDRHGTPDTKYPSPPKFFERALERIFMLQAYMAKHKSFEVWHTENDVLTYYPLDSIKLYCEFPDNPSVYVTPMGPTISTFAIAHFCSYGAIAELCAKFLEYLWMGDRKFLNLTGADMLNEMTMLSQAKNDVYIDELDTYKIWGGIGYFFDPGSYGQYLGGTNNHDHGPGYAGDHHYIGALINQGKLTATFEDGKPYAYLEGKKHPLFNLHIHSKNLKDFV